MFLTLKNKRITISKKTRFEIFKRDSFLCRYCGRGVGHEIILEIDHIIPVFEGGSNEAINLVTSCFDCNRGKSKNSLLDIKKIVDYKCKIRIIKEQKQQIKAYFLFKEEQNNIKYEMARSAIIPIIKSLQFPDRDLHKNWLNSVSYSPKELTFDDVFKASEIAVGFYLWG